MPATTAPKPSSSSKTRGKMTRVARRRGRGPSSLSDDEIEREVATDSDSSSEESEDSDIEPASDDIPLPNGDPPAGAKTPSFFGQSGNWGDMVDAETENGPSGLPVIDFADFEGHSVDNTARPTKKSKPAKQQQKPAVVVVVPSPPSSVSSEHNEAESPAEQPTRAPRADTSAARGPGQSARQAYQQRLETDPSYVPTVGEFWGHDDRLLDKDLRSLSGWWRGKWQGGRGGGGMRGFARGRGRGGFSAAVPPHMASVEEKAAGGAEDPTRPPREVPAVDRAWTHDGFEEMKRRDDHRRVAASPFRGSAVRGGRGAFIPRGATRPFVPTADQPRYGMKAEHMWTKQPEGFLHFDQSLKPRPGSGPAFRVKLSSETPGEIVRGPPKSYAPRIAPARASAEALFEQKEDEQFFVVRIPKRAGKERAVEEEVTENVAPVEEEQEKVEKVSPTVPEVVAKETPLEEIFTVRLNMAEKPPVISPPPVELKNNHSHPPGIPFRSHSHSTSISSAPVLSPIQTTFTPPHSTPPYGSPYGYPHALPPGIGMDPNGMTYEYATGRPVYLQAPPPLPVVYNPRPIMHSHLAPPFIPGHHHSHSGASPDFLSQPSHTPPYLDPSVFTMPRQSSRIEIRAPGGSGERKPSGLRTSAPMFEPSRSGTPVEPQQYYSQENPYAMGYQQQYGGPQEQYFYPGQQQQQAAAYAGGYNGGGYMDMMRGQQQQQQPGPYDMYPPQPPQGTTYY